MLEFLLGVFVGHSLLQQEKKKLEIPDELLQGLVKSMEKMIEEQSKSSEKLGCFYYKKDSK